MYRIITDLESMFDDIDAARAYIQKVRTEGVSPYIPRHAAPGEDVTTPRICVAPTLAGCATSLGLLGIFRRCLNANESAKSYENDDEAYPVIVMKFPDGLDYVKPGADQVPDVDITDEHWLLEPAVPEWARLRWIGAYSILYDDEPELAVCTKITFLRSSLHKLHPWLDGRGHKLDSSETGDML